MDFQTFIQLLRRQWITVIIITVATLFATSSIYFLQTPVEKITLLFTVGVSEDSATEKTFDATKLSDDFAKTISGWTQSPTFSERISKIAGTNVQASATTQSKQNFLLELTYANTNANDSNQNFISEATKQVIDTEIQKYNTQSKFKFFTTLHGESLSNVRKNLKKTIIAATGGGFLIAIFWLIVNAYFSGKVNSFHEAEKILKTKAILTLCNFTQTEIDFLKKIIKQYDNPILIGIDFDSAKIGEKLNLKSLQIPNDVDKFNKNEVKILIVKLDKSKIDTLHMLHAICDENVKLIVCI
jgi:capsular polysaccharide biosynthesis protein